MRGEEKPEAKMPQDLGFWDEILSKSELMRGLLKVMTLWFRIFCYSLGTGDFLDFRSSKQLIVKFLRPFPKGRSLK